MTQEQAQIVFYGSEALVLLFGLYGLYEWAVFLLAKVAARTLTASKAQNRFGVAAVVVAFLPLIGIGVSMHLQTAGIINLHSLDATNVIFLMLAALALGFVLQGCAITAFWFITRKK